MKKPTDLRIMAAAVAAALVLLTSCAMKTVSTESFGDKNAPKKVLIAYDYSSFKAQAANEAKEMLTAEGCFVTVTDVALLSAQSADSYGAVVLMAPLVAWRLDGNVRNFIEKTGDKSRIILVTTAGGTDYKADIKGVDAVTEASVLDNADTLAHTVSGKVKALFNE